MIILTRAKLLEIDASKNPIKIKVDDKGYQRTAIVISPHGLLQNPPIGSDVLLLSSSSQQSLLYGILYNPSLQPNMTDLEVVVGGFQSNAVIKFKKTGDIEISTDSKIHLNSNNIELSSAQYEVLCTNAQILDGNSQPCTIVSAGQTSTKVG